MQTELKNPFVVQCKACKEVLADSFALLALRDSLLIFNRVASHIEKEDEESKAGADIFTDCVLKSLHCHCGAEIGFRMISSNVEWNGHAGHVFLKREALRSYVLGGGVCQEKSLFELIDDVEKLKCVVSKMYKKVFQ